MMRLAMITTSLFLFLNIALAASTDHFVTTWKTDNPGTSNSTSITVPMVGGPYDVDWDNDGVFEEIGLTDSATHDFGIAGTYIIRIRGNYDSIRINYDGDRKKIVSLNQWGTQSWNSMESAFRGANYLTTPANDTPNFSSVTSMSGMFSATYYANPDTSGWDTSAVTNMSGMFLNAISANPDTSSWNTTAVTDMSSMFLEAKSANPETSGWNTAAVTDMSQMFHSAHVANPDTSGWNTGAVTSMYRMFTDAAIANPETSGWDTAAVIDMRNMFDGATSANPDTSGWVTTGVTDMTRMFFGASSANPDTSGWNTGAVTLMSKMFQNAISANPETSAWDTSAVRYMDQMFFGAISANPDVSGWDTSALLNTRGMFSGAISFDRNIGSWNVTSLRVASGMFKDVRLSTSNYDSLLIGWDSQVLRARGYFSGGESVYCSEAAAVAREHMITTDEWSISDGGRICPPVSPPDLTPETDTGESNSDNITSNNSPDFYVECSAIGNTISLYTDIPVSKTAVGNHICSTVGTEIAGVAAPLLEGIQNISYTDNSGVLESDPSPSLLITVTGAPPLPSADFVTTWKTDNPGVSSDTSILIPMVGGPYHVDWDNDGAFDEFGVIDSVTHDFGVAGIYTVRVRGGYDSIVFFDEGDKEKIISLDQWGTQAWTTMGGAFWGARFLAIPATDTPDFSAVAEMGFMFADAGTANPYTGNWDTSAVTSMHGMFNGAISANPDTSDWDTSSLTVLAHMFSGAISANPDTSGWDTSSFMYMYNMFSGAISANPDTSGWDMSSAVSMYGMFNGATAANPDTSGWNTSNVESMAQMFDHATSANPEVSGWDTSSVTSIHNMFNGATAFDQDIGSWDISAVLYARDMFTGVTLSIANYESLLVGWGAQALQTGVVFSGGNSTYCSDAATAAKANMIAADSWVITDGGKACLPPETCNVNMVSGVTEYFDASYEACEILVVGPSFIAVDGASISLSSGWAIDFLPGFSVEKGATLSANVCGQSLCMTSIYPMPYGCHSCVSKICDIDSTCCELKFDQACLDKVDTVCGLVCE